MARTFAQVEADLIKATGNRDDSDSLQLIDRAINLAIETVMLMFDLPEMHTTVTKQLSQGDLNWTLTASDRIVDILKVRDSTNSKDLSYIEPELIDWLVPSTLTLVKFWSREGNKILVRAAVPTALLDLTLSVTAFPVTISGATEIPFEGHDSELIAVALAITWAFFEEVESANLFRDIAAALGVSYEKTALLRKVIQGLPESKEVISGNTATGAKA